MGVLRFEKHLRTTAFVDHQIWFVVLSLSFFSLRGCSITEKQCLILTSALKSNPSHLRELNLSMNKLGDSGVNNLRDLLMNPQCTLKKLKLVLLYCTAFKVWWNRIMLLANGLMNMMCISRKIIVLYIFTLNQYKLWLWICFMYWHISDKSLLQKRHIWE